MPKYMCPECEAVLQRKEAVPSGKKIKCPKCDNIFLAKAMKEEPEEEKKEAPIGLKPDDEEDEGGSYGVIKEDPNEAGAKIEFEDLRKKFPKSKRGPAMAQTVTPSNLMILLGILGAVGSLVLIIVGIWPFIFSAEPPTGADARKRIFLFIVLGVVLFAAYSAICYGSTKLHSLDSLRWAWIGTIMVIILVPLLGWAVGALAIAVLKKDDVREGFEETEERRHELKNM